LPRQITSTTVDRQGGHRSGLTHFDLLARLLADNRRGRNEDGVLCAASDPTSEFRVASQQHPLLDQSAPLFTLLDSECQTWSLDEKLLRGPIVLVFYLNYGCDACVSGLFELNADIRMFQALGAEVAAISDDPAELTQRRFKRNGAFSFPVLCDPGHEVARTYSIFRPADADGPEQLLHGTFVIGEDRRVKWAHTDDAPFTRNTALLCELARLNPEVTVAAAEQSALIETEDQ
jgi:peroxiredoxin